VDATSNSEAAEPRDVEGERDREGATSLAQHATKGASPSYRDTFICLARVRLGYLACAVGDLPADSGEIVVVRRQLGKEWFYGHLASDASMTCGVVPTAHVEVIQGSVTSLGPCIVPFDAAVRSEASAHASQGDDALVGQRSHAQSVDAVGQGADDGSARDAAVLDAQAAAGDTAELDAGPVYEEDGDECLVEEEEVQEFDDDNLSELAAGLEGLTRHAPMGSRNSTGSRTRSTHRRVGSIRGWLTMPPGLEQYQDERVEAVKVPFAERKVTLDGELHSWYTIDVATNLRLIRVEKRYSDVRVLHGQLCSSLPAQGATLSDVDPHAQHLMMHKRTSAVMEARRLSMERFLEQVCKHRTACAMFLMSFVDTKRPSSGNNSTVVTSESIAAALTSANSWRSAGRQSVVQPGAGGGGPQVSAIRDGSLPGIGTSFVLQGARTQSSAQEFLRATHSLTSSHGLLEEASQHARVGTSSSWTSSASQFTHHEHGASSRFEAEHVPLRAPPFTRAASNEQYGAASDALVEGDEGEECGDAHSTAEDVPDVPPLNIEDEAPSEGMNAVGSARDFTMDSMDAFDALIEDTFAVILPDDEISTLDKVSAASDSSLYAKEGQLVRCTYTQLLWDGATTLATVLARVREAAFYVGDLRDDRVPHGLHKAVQRVPRGTPVTVVLSPDAAYGVAGRAPTIPAGAHLVYLLTLTNIEGEARDMTYFAQVSPHERKPTRLGAVAAAEPRSAMDDAMLAMAASMLQPSAASRQPSTASTAGRHAAASMTMRPAVEAPDWGAGSPTGGGRRGMASNHSSASSEPYGVLPTMSPQHSVSSYASRAPSRVGGYDASLLGAAAGARGGTEEGIVIAGRVMPTPEDAERAFRAYLALNQPG
ncbi:hypothetical protein EON62_01300, partial [archaeon]